MTTERQKRIPKQALRQAADRITPLPARA